MSAAPPISTEALSERLRAQRLRLQSLRDQARERYAGGAPGLQVATLICETTDRLIIEIFQDSLESLPSEDRQRVEQSATIIAVGGTGRGELAPYSDVDLLILRSSNCPQGFDDCIAKAIRDCWDAGIKPGHSVRTPGEALAAARSDPQFATALVEARRLWGSDNLFVTFTSRFYRKVVKNRYSRFFHDCMTARDSEKQQHGVSERQLEPDVKRSSGGLRDIHLLRWIGYAAYGTPDVDLLRRQGALTLEDAQALIAAQEFLTCVRVDLHFSAGKAQEVLTREEQLRLAELHGVAGTSGQRPVERFMQNYFRHATAIADISARFVARHRPRSVINRFVRFLFSHRSNQIFRVSGGEIDVAPRHRDRLCGSLEGLLNLYELAALYSANITPELREQIRLAVPRLPRTVSPAASQMFLSILRATGNVGKQLRSMFATGLLDIVVPEVTHARCLLQFNQYHSFTVDEHSLRAVEAAEALDSDPGPFGMAYRNIRHKDILHLAVLLHDLGKGFEQDHSIVGRELAENVGARLGLPQAQREMLVFLVHKHLLMAHLAFRRDLSDQAMLARFSRDVGNPEWLRMLYVLTAADIMAVGPGAWTSWKAELVSEMFDRSLQVLTGAGSRFRENERIRQVVERMSDVVRSRKGKPHDQTEGTQRDAQIELPEEPAELQRLVSDFPSHYLTSTAPIQIVDDLIAARRVASQKDAVIVSGAFEPTSQTVEYSVVTCDRVGSGLFSAITGVLTAKGLQILSANICTTSDRIVIDRFRVIDTDHVGPVPDFRLLEVESAIVTAIRGEQTVESLFQRHRRFSPRTESPVLEPTQVVIDNDSSERFTIIDIFAHDVRGLLYTIATALFDLNLSVSLAKISTHLDQVLDVFYVTDREGMKLQDGERLTKIRETLESRIEEFERQARPVSVTSSFPSF